MALRKSKLTSLLKAIIMLVIILVIFIIEIFYRVPLYEESELDIASLQRATPPGSMEFFSIISNLGLAGIALAVAAILFVFTSRDKALCILVVMVAHSYINQILKMYY